MAELLVSGDLSDILLASGNRANLRKIVKWMKLVLGDGPVYAGRTSVKAPTSGPL